MAQVQRDLLGLQVSGSRGFLHAVGLDARLASSSLSCTAVATVVWLPGSAGGRADECAIVSLPLALAARISHHRVDVLVIVVQPSQGGRA